MRECNRCRKILPDEQFHSKSAKCKACKAGIDRGRKRDNPTDVRRNNTDNARARKRRWMANNRDAAKETARRAVRLALNRGALIRPIACTDCGASRTRRDGISLIQAHHDDYTRPLDVRWLCATCHTAVHKDAARQGEKG